MKEEKIIPLLFEEAKAKRQVIFKKIIQACLLQPALIPVVQKIKDHRYLSSPLGKEDKKLLSKIIRKKEFESFLTEINEIREYRQERRAIKTSPGVTEAFRISKENILNMFNFKKEDIRFDAYGNWVHPSFKHIYTYLDIRYTQMRRRDLPPNFELEYTDFDWKKRGSMVKLNLHCIHPEFNCIVLQKFWYAQWKSKEHSTSKKAYFLLVLDGKRIHVQEIDSSIANALRKDIEINMKLFHHSNKVSNKMKEKIKTQIDEIIQEGRKKYGNK